MMQKTRSIFGCLLFACKLFAGDGDYAVSKISPALLKNANAVLRLEEMEVEISSAKEYYQRYHYVITILNENGDFWADFNEGYDKLQDLTSVEGLLYDAEGRQIKKMKFKDLQDVSGVDDNNLIDDNRVKHHNFYYKVYPYTIEYTSVLHYRHTLYFPMWSPQGGEKLSVEKSVAKYIFPADYKLRYKSFQYDGQVVEGVDKNKRTLTWEATNMPAIIREPFGPRWHDITTVVIFGPGEFQVGDYKGNMQSWEDFGKFVYALKQNRDALPGNVKQAIHNLVDGVTEEKKKIQLLYEYMQKNTRYISIQLGIGGWQPFEASYVASKGYGDCKALSNYMYSILKEAGISSYYTIIRAGKNENYITSDFPSQQFNHVILCVPLQKDTVWLECTSQTMPTGYLGDFTCDRYALLVNETGGKLIRTPRYKLIDNLAIKKIKGVLDSEASLNLQVTSVYKGLQQDDIHDMLNYLSKDKVKEYLQRKFDFATYELDKFDYKENKSMTPDIEEQLQISVSNYANITGKRLFISPNIMSKSFLKLRADEERKFDIVLNNEYWDVDSVEIQIPAGYEPESLPQPVSIESKFGKYSASIKVEQNRILYYRLHEYYSGRFSPKDYPELVKFYDNIYKADRNKIVFVKSD
jgi:hypothetical protein